VQRLEISTQGEIRMPSSTLLHLVKVTIMQISLSLPKVQIVTGQLDLAGAGSSLP
jgi:hypothetical protein